MTQSEVEIDITWDDIACGIRGNSHTCPIALAARRVFTDYEDLYVVLAGVRITKFGRCPYFYRFDSEANAFRSDFDYGRRVKPCKVKVFKED